MPTLFEKFWTGELPTPTVFKSEERGVMAIPSLSPATFGHVVIFPRNPIDKVNDLPTEDKNQLRLVADAIERFMGRVLDIERVTSITSGYGVPHAHINLIPNYAQGDAGNFYDHPEKRDDAYMESIVALLPITDDMVATEASR